jgi:hypothetical protein
LVVKRLLVVVAFGIVVVITPIAPGVILTMTKTVGAAHTLLLVLVILTVAVVLPRDVANWHTRTVIANPSSLMFNAPHASAWDTWLSTVTCLPLRSVWNGT